MGTHAVVTFKEENDIIVSYYFQYDGYLEGVGLMLVQFLLTREMCSGIPLGSNPENGKIWANGIECLAAQFCAEFKKSPGNMYIHRGGKEEFNYNVILTYDNVLQIEYNEIIYNLEDFLSLCNGNLMEKEVE